MVRSERGRGGGGAEIADEMYTWDFCEFADVLRSSGGVGGGTLEKQPRQKLHTINSIDGKINHNWCC